MSVVKSDDIHKYVRIHNLLEEFQLKIISIGPSQGERAYIMGSEYFISNPRSEAIESTN